MSTTPEDPFAAPPATSGTGPTPGAGPTPATPATPPSAPPSTPPGVLAPDPVRATPPGVLAPSPVAATPPPYASPAPGQAPPGNPAYGPPPEAPNGLALAAIVATGAYLLLSLILAAMAPATLEKLKDQLADPENPTVDFTSTGLALLSYMVAIASYVFLAVWMMRIRQNLTATGNTPGGPPAVEWWGWFIPVANYVLPALGMRAISRRSAGVGVLLAWWVPFCAFWTLTFAATVAQLSAVNFTTGKLTNPEALDATVPLTLAAAAALLLSWIFLVVLIRRTTSRHLSA